MEWTISGTLLAVSCLAVWRVPHIALWKPAVGATAFGAWLIPLHLLLGSMVVSSLGPAVLVLVSVAILFTPWARALAQQRTLARAVRETWGTPTEHTISPLPITADRILNPHPVHLAPQTHVYDHAHGLTLNLFPGRKAGLRPVVVLLHGGAWARGDATQLTSTPTYLCDLGYSVVALNYRLAPTHSHPAQLDDIDRALGWVAMHSKALNLDPNRVVLMGRSAGGHLALLSAYARHPYLCGVAALYPPTDLVWSWAHPTPSWILDTPGSLTDFVGAPLDQATEAYREASPLQMAHADCPPTLLMHGGRDELVYPKQSQRLAATLARLGVQHQFIETPWDTHGFDANLKGPGGLIWTHALEHFLSAVTATPSAVAVACAAGNE